jgi:hypothetical protein
MHLALNLQWKMSICFGPPSLLMLGAGLLVVAPRKYFSNCIVVQHINVYCSRDMATIVFIIKLAINDLV